MNATDLYGECIACFGNPPSFPDEMLQNLSGCPVAGRGFFPVASGSLHTNNLLASVRRDFMFVGQDWGDQGSFKILKCNQNADADSPTVKQLIRLLGEADVRIEDCFFTNALFGIRKGSKSTGPSPGWQDQNFVNRCERALRKQFDEVQPKAIVCLGRDAPELIARIVHQCKPWATAKGFVAIDNDDRGLIFDASAGGRMVDAAILVHPSMRNSNAGCRSYQEIGGSDAEILLLKVLQHKLRLTSLLEAS